MNRGAFKQTVTRGIKRRHRGHAPRLSAPKLVAPQSAAPMMGGGAFSSPARVAAAGRGGDTMLAHINPQEAALLKAQGGSGTINPRTGLREYKYGGDTNEGGAHGFGGGGFGGGNAAGRGGISDMALGRSAASRAVSAQRGTGLGGTIGRVGGAVLGTLAGGPLGGVLGYKAGGALGNTLGNTLGGTGSFGAGGTAGNAGAGLGATGGSGNAVRDLFHSTSLGSPLGNTAASSPVPQPPTGANPYAGIPQRAADYSFQNPQQLIAPGAIDGGGAFTPPGGGSFQTMGNRPFAGGMFSRPNATPGMPGLMAPPQVQYPPQMQVPLPWPMNSYQGPRPSGFGGIRG